MNAQVIEEKKMLDVDYNKNNNKLIQDLEEVKGKYVIVTQTLAQKENEVQELHGKIKETQVVVDDLKNNLLEVNKMKDTLDMERKDLAIKVDTIEQQLRSELLKQTEQLHEMKKSNENMEQFVEESKLGRYLFIHKILV